MKKFMVVVYNAIQIILTGACVTFLVLMANAATVTSFIISTGLEGGFSIAFSTAPSGSPMVETWALWFVAAACAKWVIGMVRKMVEWKVNRIVALA